MSKPKTPKKWNHENELEYGTLHCISLKAALTVGYNASSVVGHFYHLQKLHPRGGHIPETNDGKRACYNSFAQIHNRLPFISPRTIKSIVKSLARKYPGFKVFRYPGRKENQYYISPELADELDLVRPEKKLYFHEGDAILYGTLEAILLQYVTFSNVSFADQVKPGSHPNPVRAFKRFAKDKRTVQRAITNLEDCACRSGIVLLKQDDDGGYYVPVSSRQMWFDYLANKKAQARSAKAALKQSKIDTVAQQHLHQPLQELHTLPLIFESQSTQDVPITQVVESLNRSNQIGSTTRSKVAAPTLPLLVPKVPIGASLIDGEWIEFDCRIPSKASPAMVTRSNHDQTADVDDDDAQREGLQSTTVHSCAGEAQPEPRLANGDDALSERSTLAPAATRKKHSPVVIESRQERERRELLLVTRFRQVIVNSGLVPDSDDSDAFLNELRRNPELRQPELETIYQRFYDSVVGKHQLVYPEGTFNPYYHSTGLDTAKQLIAKFYLILSDQYKVSQEEYYRTGCEWNALGADTPEHIRRYIERKRANSDWSKERKAKKTKKAA